MKKELLEHIDAFGLAAKRIGKFRLKEGDDNFIKEYLEVYYPGQRIVPVSILNPLYDILGTHGGMSLSYSGENNSKLGLVRYHLKKNAGVLFIAAPEMQVDRDKLVKLTPKYGYSDLIKYLILEKAIEPILNFYMDDIIAHGG